MYILQHPNGNDFFTDFNAASAEFETWGFGNLKENLAEEFSQFSIIEIDTKDPKTINIYVLELLINPLTGEVIAYGLPDHDEANIVAMWAEFERFKACYQCDADAFYDEEFVMYWALHQAELAGNTNLRRKDSLHNPERNGRFLMNTQFDKTNQIQLVLDKASLAQFNAVGVRHPYQREIINGIEDRYKEKEHQAKQERQQTQNRVKEIGSEVISLQRKIKALEEEKAALKALDKEQAEREVRDIERIRTNLSATLMKIDR